MNGPGPRSKGLASRQEASEPNSLGPKKPVSRHGFHPSNHFEEASDWHLSRFYHALASLGEQLVQPAQIRLRFCYGLWIRLRHRSLLVWILRRGVQVAEGPAGWDAGSDGTCRPGEQAPQEPVGLGRRLPSKPAGLGRRLPGGPVGQARRLRRDLPAKHAGLPHGLPSPMPKRPARDFLDGAFAVVHYSGLGGSGRTNKHRVYSV